MIAALVFVALAAAQGIAGQAAAAKADEKKPVATSQSTSAAKDGGAQANTGSQKPVPKVNTVPVKAGAAPKAAAPKTEYTYASFWPKYFQAAVSYRGRLEDPSGRSFANDSGDGYYLSRMRFEATLKVNKYVDFYGMTQDSRVIGYDDASKRPSGMMDVFDLRQAYVDIHKKGETRSFAFRFGTQNLDFGSKRLVATATWGNSPPVWDAAKVNYTMKGMTVDVFASTRVSTVHAYGFNEPKKGENLYGTYMSFDKLVPKAKIEPYVFWRTQPLVTDEKKKKGDSDLFTYGLRFYGTLPYRIDYTAEFAIQRGTYAADRVSAWAGTWGMGYVLNKSAFKPRVLLEYNYASGDQAKLDGTRGTFDQLYASNHSLYGIADQAGWKNTRNYKIGFEVQATKSLKVQFDVNDFYLATRQDAYYTDSGSSVLTNAKSTSRHIGWEPDLQATYKVNKQVTIGGGFGRLVPGAYLKQSTAGFAFNYPYIFWEFRY
jgi:hypothetical protein